MIRDWQAKQLVERAFRDAKNGYHKSKCSPGYLVKRIAPKTGRQCEIITHSDTPGWTGYYLDGVLAHEEGDDAPRYTFSDFDDFDEVISVEELL